jgi:hypothetical protein
MNGPGNRRPWSIILAASLGLNLALGGLLIYQGVSAEKAFERRLHEWRANRDSRWREQPSRSGTAPDSTRHPTRPDFPRLEEDQIDQLRAMRRAFEADTDSLKREVGRNQRLIRSELSETEPSMARIDSLTNRNARLQHRIQRRIIVLMLREKEILTPEQFEFFLRYMIPGQDRYGDSYRRGERGRNGPPGNDRNDGDGSRQGGRGGDAGSGNRTVPPAEDPIPLIPYLPLMV